MDFGRIIHVKQVKIHLAGKTRFCYVEIKLGNSNNYVGNPVIYPGTIAEESSDFMIKTVEASSGEAQNWHGQYMQLMSMKAEVNVFAFYEIQVVEFPDA